MTSGYDIRIADVPFMALSPHDARRVRRGGVVVWAAGGPGGWRALAVEESASISRLESGRPPGADLLLVSPPIDDEGRRRAVRAAVEGAGALGNGDARPVVRCSVQGCATVLGRVKATRFAGARARP